ncbi:hypothetical protein RSAG8_10452, partial [Rhizoctonia solani AG-8 WAC10335]
MPGKPMQQFITTEVRLLGLQAAHSTMNTSSTIPNWANTSYQLQNTKECIDLTRKRPMFFALQLDRGNISAALSDNLLDDLGLNTNDYNNGQMIFYLTFMCAELPSQLISKRLGPDVWLPIQLVLWSIVAMSQCRLNSRGSFFATRCLLGLLEGGFIPDMILFLSYFYKGNELPVRLSFFWMSYTFTNISGALLGYGILRMRGLHGWEGWRYLFLIEGTMTAAIGLFSFFWLPASPTQTKGILRGKDGWFTEREEIIMVNRILRDDPSKGGMHNRQALHLSDFWASITDYDNWGFYLIGICAYIPPAPPTAYMTLTLRNLGFNTFNSNLLTIPYSVLFMINNFLITQVSAALYNIFVQAGNIIATHIYNDDDKPFYHKGNKVLVGITVWNIILFYLVKLYYIQRNKWKATRWNAMSTEERAHYLETTTDKGNKRLDFVFMH